MATLITAHSPKPTGMSGKAWRRMRSHIRRHGAYPRAHWKRAWSYIRELGEDPRQGRTDDHPANRAMLAAVRCYQERAA